MSDIETKLRLDTSEAQAATSEFTGGMTDGFVSINASIEVAQKAFQAMVGIVDAVTDAIERLTDASDIQLQAERRLETQAKLRGQFTDDLLAKTQDFNAALQNLTARGDETTLGIEQQALALGIQRGELEKVTLAAVGFASVHGGDASSAVVKLARLIGGETDVLKRYGVVVTDVNDTLNDYVDAAELATLRSDTLAGQIDITQSAWGDLIEKVGDVLNQSKELQRVERELRDTINEVGSEVKDNEDKWISYVDKITQKTEFFFTKLKERILESRGLLTPLLLSPAALVAGALEAGFSSPEVTDAGPLSGVSAGDFEDLAAKQRLEEAKSAEIAKRETAKQEKERERAARAAAKARDREAKERRRQERDEQRAIERHHAELARIEQDAEAEHVAGLEASAQKEKEIEETKARNLETFLRGNVAEIFNILKETRDEETAGLEALATAGVALIAQGVSASISAVVDGLIAGEDDILGKVGGIFGGLISSLGDSVISLGISAVAASALSAIPFLAPLVGPPGAGAAVGAAAIAAGIAIKAIGAGLGAVSSGGGAGAAAGGSAMIGRVADTVPGSAASDDIRKRTSQNAVLRRLERSRRGQLRSDTSSAGFSDGPSELRTVYNLNFRAGMIVGRSEHEAGRALEKVRRNTVSRLGGRAA